MRKHSSRFDEIRKELSQDSEELLNVIKLFEEGRVSREEYFSIRSKLEKKYAGRALELLRKSFTSSKGDITR